MRVVVISTLVACGTEGSAPPGIEGSLVVHTSQTANPPPGESTNFTSVKVFLGDGAVFLADTDSSGDVVFEDPNLVGPQDVTVVTVSTSGDVSALTVVEVDVPELALGLVVAFPTVPVAGTLSGQVTGFDPGHAVEVTLYGTQIFGGATAAADGTFSMEFRGELGGTTHLLAKETSDTGVVRVGMVRDIAVTAAISQDIVLDHPVSSTLGVTLDGLASFPAGTPTGSLNFDIVQDFGLVEFDSGLRPLFTTVGTGSALPTVEMTAPFDDAVRTATMSAGDFDIQPGVAIAKAIVDRGETEVAIALPQPTAISEPVVANAADPAPTVALGSLRVAWNVDPEAVYVNGRLRSNGATQFSWSFFSPAERGSFAPFALPAATAPITAFPAGELEVFVRANWHRDHTRLTDAFENRPVEGAPRAGRLSWSTDTRGHVILQ